MSWKSPGAWLRNWGRSRGASYVLIPAALEGAITKDDAEDVKADIIIEAANAPMTPEADEILNKREVLI